MSWIISTSGSISWSNVLAGRPGIGLIRPINERVTVASKACSFPASNLRREKAWKSEHWRPSTSMIWIYSPSLTVKLSAVAQVMRISCTGSANGSGKGWPLPLRAFVRRTKISIGVAVSWASKSITPPMAAIIATPSCCTVISALLPAVDASPNTRTAFASLMSMLRRFKVASALPALSSPLERIALKPSALLSGFSPRTAASKRPSFPMPIISQA